MTCVVSSLVVFAGNITTQQAETIARQFLKKNRPAVSNKAVSMAQREPLSIAADATAYYVFNVGEDAGYVMVNGSTFGPQVLAYAKKGAFNQTDMPDNMKAWLAGYADQIAYLEKTGGVTQAPRQPDQYIGGAVAPLILSTWSQGYPYNMFCPTDPSTGNTSVTGCVATALAQVINYYKYPSETIESIPSYTTSSLSITLPEIGITTLDWGNMLNSYNNGYNDAQAQAVATLMKLCGQATEMDYSSTSSGAYTALDVRALTKYFGYDQTAQAIDRNAFSAMEWETIIYEELAANRPVIYSGASTGGGHSFIVDGCDTNGYFHINWGWNGSCDNYFLLSVLNPYNNSGIGASSTDDGYSFGQEAIIGIQHGTGETIPQIITAYNISNTGASKYTRTSADADFTGISITPQVYNMSGDTHQFSLALGLFNSDFEFNSWLLFQNGAYGSVGFGELPYLYGGSYEFTDINLGAGLADGEYWIMPVSNCDENENWQLVWCAMTYKIKATISGNTLTLEEPSINLSGTVSATDVPVLGETVNLTASVYNKGSYFNNDVYLFINNVRVGGRHLEADEKGTATVDLDFVPTATGEHSIVVAYYKDGQYIPFLAGSIDVKAERPAAILKGDVNADGQVNVTDAAVTVDYIIGKTPTYFNKEAADVNGDGDINITDVVIIVDAIIGKTVIN